MLAENNRLINSISNIDINTQAVNYKKI